MIKQGDVVRPFIHTAGLEPTKLYRVAHVERGLSLMAPMELCYLEDPTGAVLPPILNAHLVLEVVRAHTMRPTLAALN